MEFCPVLHNVLATHARGVCIFRCFMYICVNNFTFGPWVPTQPFWSLSPLQPSLSACCLNTKVARVPPWPLFSLHPNWAILSTAILFFSSDLLCSKPRDTTGCCNSWMPLRCHSLNRDKIKFPSSLNYLFFIASIFQMVVGLKPETKGTF